jgi:gliding motility-associated-like protein
MVFRVTKHLFNFLVLIFSSNVLFAQTPSFDITPSGNMSVCSGASVSLTAGVTSPFAGTNTYTVSDIPFSPYTMLGGTNLTMTDDFMTGVLPIGFQFCFFGNTYTQFYIGSNGWIGFTPGQPVAFTATGIPSLGSFVPKNCIMGPWHDLNPGFGTGPYVKYQTQGMAPYRRLVVQWTNCPMYQCTSTTTTFQIVIFESTNIIEHYITNKPTCLSWAGGTATQGLHNQMGTIAVSVPGRNASVWTATNDGKRFLPSGPPNFTVNWTSNGVPIGTGNTITTSITSCPAATRIIGRVNFQCSNLVLYDTLNVTCGGTANAAFSIPPIVCAGQPANFTYTGGAAGSGAWTFGSGSPASSSGLGTQSTTWATPGTYPVGLTVTPSSGLCLPGSLTQNITVTAPPTSTFVFPANVCTGTSGTLTYSGTAPTGSTYAWSFGMGATPSSATGVGPHTVVWSTTGAKNVSLTVTSGACSSTSTNTVNVNTTPTSTFTYTSSTLCVNANNTFSFTGSAATGAVYNWNFGADASPAAANTVGPHSVSWTTGGSKTITLQVTAGGCTSIVNTQTIGVNSIPSSSFTLPSAVCQNANTTITYTGGAPAPPLATYTWSLSGASPSIGNIQGPLAVNWSTSGLKTVTLSVAQSGCVSTTTSNNITVNPVPVVNIASSVPTVCVNQAAAFNVTGTPPATGSTYAWTFPGATPLNSSSAGPVSANWATAGAQSANLVVTTSGCSSSPAIANVTITAPPSSAFSLPAQACINTPVAIAATGTFVTGTVFNWNFSGATVLSGSGAGPYIVQWPTSGNQTVTFTASIGTCSSTTSAVINIKTGATVSFSLPTTTCLNQSNTISFTGTASGAATYSWNFGAGATPATANTVGPHSVNWGTAGTKSVTLNVTDNGCTAPTQTQTISVNAAYTSTFTLPANNCIGNQGTVTYTGNALTGATYAWNFGAGSNPSTATTAGPHNVTWSNAGNSTVSLTVGVGTCSSSSTSTTTINTNPVANFSAASIVGTGNLTPVTFTGTALTGSSYSWNFGAGASPLTASTVGPHSVSWSTAGSKTITLTVIQNGCTSTFSQNVSVINAATATFTAPSAVCEGTNANIVYTGNATTGATYNWNFDGGVASPGIGAGPHTVTWATSGTKNISLIVTQSGVSSTAFTSSVVVNPIPTSTFTLPSIICAGTGGTVTYTGTAPIGANYTWNFGSGSNPSTATTRGPHSIIWSNAGTPNVSLTVTQNGCVSAVTTQTATVQALPLGSFNLPSTGCVGQPVTISYSGGASPSANYNWNFGANSSPATATSQGPQTITWTSAGTYNVFLFLTENSCTSTPVSHTIQINPTPSASFTLSNPACVNEGVMASFNASAITGATYNWSYPSATLISGSGQGPINIFYTTPGIQTVTLSVSANGCTSTLASQSTNINSPATFTIASAAYVGLGLPTVVTYNGTQPAGTTYNWNFDGGTVIAGSGIGPYTIQWSTTGIKNITCTASLNGCSSITQITSTEVVGAPINSFTAQNPICVGDSSIITFNGVALNSASYSWDLDGGILNSGTGPGPLSVSWPSSGLKTISLTVSQLGLSATTTQTVLVNGIPSSSFSLPSFACSNDTINVNYTGNAGTGATFNWNFGTGNLLNQFSGISNQLIYPNSDSTEVSLSVTENGCTSLPNIQNLIVRPKPIATFNLNNFSCEGSSSSINFSGSVASNPSFNWNFDTGTLQSGSGPGPLDILWSQPGLQNVSLFISENGCVSETYSTSVNVIPRPTSNFIVTTDSCVNSPVMLSYIGDASDSAQFNWDYTGATFIGLTANGNQLIQYGLSGNHIVSLTVTENGCTSLPFAQNFTLNQPPIANFTMQDTIFVVQNANAAFIGFAEPSTTFNWNYLGANLISTGSDNSLVLNYNTIGDYTVTLVLNNNGCISQPYSETITVIPIPSSEFTSSQDSICAFSAIAFVYDSSFNSQATYTWNFDGGIIESGSGVGPYAVSWTEAGTKNVSLIVNVGNVSSILTSKSIEVIAIPIAAFDIEDQVCLGETITASYSDVPGSNFQYQWEIDGAQIIDQTIPQNISIVWDTAGVKLLTLSIADAMCISVPFTQSVLVNQIPTSTFSLPNYACKSNEIVISYSGNASSAANFEWDFGSGILNSGTGLGPLSVNWMNTGYATVSLIVTENGCISTLTDTVIPVRENPIADAGIDRLICSGDTIQIGNSPTTNYSYNWFPSNGVLNDTVANPLLLLETMHDYVETVNFLLTVNDGFCSANDSVSFNVAPMPQAAFEVPAPQCFNGNSFDFTPSGVYNSEATFFWNFGPHGYSHSPTEINQNDISFDVTGYQTVSLVISQFGCTSETFVDSVLVNEHPIVDYSAINVKGCVPLTTTFSGISSFEDNAIFNWNFGDGNSSQGQNISHDYLESGYMSVTLTVIDANGCSGTAVKQSMVEVLEQPIAGFRTYPEIVLIGAEDLELTSLSQNALYCYYVIEGDTILGCPSSYSFTDEGIYTITQVVVNAKGCTDEVSHTVQVEYGTEYYIPTAFTPNADGTNDVFTVEGEKLKNFNLIIFDRWGNEIFSSSDPAFGWNGYNADGSFAYPEGVYPFKLEMRSYTNRDIVENGQITLFR